MPVFGLRFTDPSSEPRPVPLLGVEVDAKVSSSCAHAGRGFGFWLGTEAMNGGQGIHGWFGGVCV